MLDSKKVNNEIFSFFVLVFALSIPFWVLGFIIDTTKTLPIKLPIAALMSICPLLAAAILTYKKSKIEGLKNLVKKVTDAKKIQHTIWYLVIIFLMPITAILSYWYLKIRGELIPQSAISLLSLIIFFVVYFIGAIGEEVGWSGYIIQPLQTKYGALKASIFIGVIWAIWHVIPYYQAHQTTGWIVWQCIGTVLLRIIMVWIFNNAGKSVFAMVLFHTMINISPYLIPKYGANYNPFIFASLLIFVIISIFIIDKKNLLNKF